MIYLFLSQYLFGPGHSPLRKSDGNGSKRRWTNPTKHESFVQGWKETPQRHADCRDNTMQVWQPTGKRIRQYDHSAPKLVLQVIVCESIWYIHFTVWSATELRNALPLTLIYIVRCDTTTVRRISTWNEMCTWIVCYQDAMSNRVSLIDTDKQDHERREAVWRRS